MLQRAGAEAGTWAFAIGTENELINSKLSRVWM
jgi:hypothetical protein